MRWRDFRPETWRVGDSHRVIQPFGPRRLEARGREDEIGVLRDVMGGSWVGRGLRHVGGWEARG